MPRKFLILILLFIILLASIAAALCIGSADVPLLDVIKILFGADTVNSVIITEVRLPRVLNALLVGSSLAASGIILQSLLKNNLAEPGLLGISAGAGLGAILLIITSTAIPIVFGTAISFLFAVLTTVLIFLIARGFNLKYTNFIPTNKIILAGIAINALLSSINSFLLVISGENVSRIITWLNGGLSGKGWSDFYFTAIFAAAGLLIALLISKELNLLTLGDELASSLGLNIKVIQYLSIAASSLLAASAVSVAGVISFAGLIVPNIARLIISSDYRYAIPCSILLGGIFLVLSDLIARIIISPAELPVGIITSFLGAPVFIKLILSKKRESI